jgi:hypothetical protein
MEKLQAENDTLKTELEASHTHVEHLTGGVAVLVTERDDLKKQVALRADDHDHLQKIRQLLDVRTKDDIAPAVEELVAQASELERKLRTASLNLEAGTIRLKAWDACAEELQVGLELRLAGSQCPELLAGMVREKFELRSAETQRAGVSMSRVSKLVDHLEAENCHLAELAGELRGTLDELFKSTGIVPLRSQFQNRSDPEHYELARKELVRMIDGERGRIDELRAKVGTLEAEAAEKLEVPK